MFKKKMAASAKLSGETLIVRHIPLAHGQSVGCQLYSSLQRPIRPCSLKLTHSISLPEREEPPRDSDFLNFRSHSRKSSSNDEGGSTDQGAEITRRYNSSPTFHLNHSLRKAELTFRRSSPRWQNPFLPESEMHEDDEEDDDSHGDNLHKYREGSSFQLQGNLNGSQDEALQYNTDIWLECSSQCSASSPVCSHRFKMLQQGPDLFGTSSEHKQMKSLLDSDFQHCRDSKSTPVLMDCEEQEWGDEEDCDEYILKERTGEEKCEESKSSDSESSAQKHTEYASDSSCNSSDGVLVNFSAIYNKTNNAVPATPHDLDSPAEQFYGSGSFKDDFKPVACWSPCGFDPNCNIYQLGPDLAPLEDSDLTVSLQSQARLTSTQNYYKLVTCDLSSQSSLSPAWSSLTSCSEGHSQGSLTPPTEYFLFRQPEGEEGELVQVYQRNIQDHEDTDSRSHKKHIKGPSKGTKERTNSTIYNSKFRGPEPNAHELNSSNQSQSWDGRQECHSSQKLESLPRVPSCPSQINLDLSCAPKQHITSFAELARCKKLGGNLSSMENSLEAPTCSKFTHNTFPIQRKSPLGENIVPGHITKMSEQSDIWETPSTSQGACASSQEVVRYSKAQRPTFLPIQPFVLQPPSGKQHNKSLGSLLNQYISHKHGKPSTSKSTGKCKGLSSHLRPSPFGNYSSMHLETATSSDTCSTCTPSPVQPHYRTHWAQPSALLVQDNPELDQKESSPKTLEPKLSPVQTSVDKAYLTARESFTDLDETPLKPFLTMEPLQKPHTEQVSPLSPVRSEKLIAPKTSQDTFVNFSCSPAITSVISLTSDTALTSLSSHGRRLQDPADVAQTNKELRTTSAPFELMKQPGVLAKKPHQHSFPLTNRQPEEFCLSPHASSEFLSIDRLQKNGMLKTVRLAVDLILAHFSSNRDPEEKIRLGNSSLCPSISQLVLGQLCPAIQNILQDGLKAFKLDLIVGQRRNKPWSVVEASTQPGASTCVLHSLVSVVRKCSQLTSHSMRVNAFFMGLLNLRALESWFRHLHACVDVVTEYYHHWSFMALSQGPAYKSLFQEFLLLVQPLNNLPFDLHLLSEPRLQRKQTQKPSRPSALSGCSFFQILSNQKNDRHPVTPTLQEEGELGPLSDNESCTSCGTNIAENIHRCAVTFCKQPRLCSPEEKDEPKFFPLIFSERECAGWWLGQTPVTEGVIVTSDNASYGQNEELSNENSERVIMGLLQTSEVEKPPKQLRWARLFGSGIDTTVVAERTEQNNSKTQKTRLPSQWLKLGASKVDLLAQSVWGRNTRSLGQGEPLPKQRQ